MEYHDIITVPWATGFRIHMGHFFFFAGVNDGMVGPSCHMGHLCFHRQCRCHEDCLRLFSQLSQVQCIARLMNPNRKNALMDWPHHKSIGDPPKKKQHASDYTTPPAIVGRINLTVRTRNAQLAVTLSYQVREIGKLKHIVCDEMVRANLYAKSLSSPSFSTAMLET